uniref:Class III HD-Zip protein HDZ32 n=1 Tax=Selaginella kraussiana TaxID=81964 RepID=Q0Q434_9TRAC|nr:class III HD-Zip protein HDZ32 [Selaginella kraussiana]
MRMTKDKGGDLDSGKYIRYTPEQVEALERVYHECPKPSSIRRQQIVRDYPVLANIEPRQIKVWFQNRRCREKQRKETSRLQSVNSSLTAMNKIIMEENERLTKHSSQLSLDNQLLRQQLQQLRNNQDPDRKSSDRLNDQALALADRSPDSEVTGGVPHHHLTMAPQSPRDSSPAGLLSIAEETLNSFLAKATGTLVDWIQIPGMKPGPDSISAAAISHGSAGVAARAVGLVDLEPIRVAEILKDRPSWLWDCRRLEVVGTFPTPNGGTLELIYSQMYAPTTLAPARDFWTLRYTIFLEDRSLVVCEKSLTGAHGKHKGGPDFERAEMLPSGFLIRPYEGGVSSIHIVDHYDLESWRVLEVLRPLYESSVFLAQRVTIAALQHLKRISQESSGEILLRGGQQPAALRAFSHRIARGFNDAVNGFAEDGWVSLVADGIDTVSITINTSVASKALPGNQVWPDRFSNNISGILCAKSSMLLQNVPPATLIRFLREHRSEWVGCNSATSDSVSALRISGYGTSKGDEEPELLEVIKMEGYGSQSVPKDTVLLQLCTGYTDNVSGTCAQLIFAPVDPAVTNDMPLLPSGFRVIPLDSGSALPTKLAPTLDLASTLDTAKFPDDSSSAHCRSVLTMAFQFVFEAHNREEIISSARQYVRNVMVSVQSIAMALASFRMSPQQGPKQPEARIIAEQIVRGFRSSFGVELSDGSTDAFWNEKDAILCCTWKAIPEFIFANRSGLEMMETTWRDLHSLPYERTFDSAGRETAYSDFAQVLHQGYAQLPGGVRISSKGHTVAYDSATAWKVYDEEGNVTCIAFMFTNWTIL